MKSKLAELFADWSIGLRLSSVPSNVLIQAQKAALDLLGVMACGSIHPTVVRTRDAFAVVPGPCSVVGGRRSSSAAAALVNGTAAHVWDFDDTSYTGIMHGSAVVLPAVLAAIEECGGSDEELLTAFIVGSEVAYTLADVTSHAHYYRGWWSTATFGLVGATAGAARAYGLNEDATAHAIGMAAAAAGASKAIFGTDGKAFLVGETARRAIDFVKAAAAGLTGSHDAFEDSRGFLALLGDGTSLRHEAETLGIRWRLLDPGLLFKLNPVCSAAHAVIEATAELMRDSGATVEQIEEIYCGVPELVAISLMFDTPSSAQQAQFSLPYAVACAVLHGRVRLEDLQVQEVMSAAKRSIMRRVKHGIAGDLASEPMKSRYPESARVMMRLASGETFEHFCAEAYGMPSRPLRADELWEKFTRCTAYAGIPRVDIDTVYATLAGHLAVAPILRIARALCIQYSAAGG